MVRFEVCSEGSGKLLEAQVPLWVSDCSARGTERGESHGLGSFLFQEACLWATEHRPQTPAGKQGDTCASLPV